MSTVNIRIKKTIRDMLDVTKDQLKKRRKGKISHGDAIESLYKKIKDQRAEKREWQAKGVLADATQKEVVALGEGAETTKDLIEQPIREMSEHAQCPHYTPSEDEGIVVCRKDHFKKGTIHRIPENVCMKCWQQNKDVLVPTVKPDEEKVECLCRYEHAGTFYCVKSPPRAVPLAHNLKTCLACPDRLTKDKAEQRGLILRTKNYVTCKAKEVMDSKVGLMLYCEKEGGRWVQISHCKKIKCEHLKTVRTT